MKHVQTDFKETLFDWDCEPALERPARIAVVFSERSRSPVRPPRRRIGGVLFVVFVTIGAGISAIVLLRPLLRAIV